MVFLKNFAEPKRFSLCGSTQKDMREMGPTRDRRSTGRSRYMGVRQGHRARRIVRKATYDAIFSNPCRTAGAYTFLNCRILVEITSMPEALTNRNSSRRPCCPSRVASLSDADMIFPPHATDRLLVMLLRSRVTAQYAVCSVDPAREMVFAPNFKTHFLGTRLVGTLSKQSVNSILDWTDRETALSRYADLYWNHNGMPGKVLPVGIASTSAALTCA